MPSYSQKWVKSGLTLLQAPALQDNYVYILYSESTRECLVVDTPEVRPIIECLNQSGWKLTHILNTHHHGDHVGGNSELQDITRCEIIGYAADAARIPRISRTVEEGEIFEWGGARIKVLFLPGHTLGHIAYYFIDQQWLFCGDVLFMMGCGRLFEGTAEQMYESLLKIAALPEETLIFCAHEYTLTNGRFALLVDSNNADLQERMQEVRVLREQGRPTVPATLGVEKRTNPFLGCTLEEFRHLRALRNDFS